MATRKSKLDKNNPDDVKMFIAAIINNEQSVGRQRLSNDALAQSLGLTRKTFYNWKDSFKVEILEAKNIPMVELDFALTNYLIRQFNKDKPTKDELIVAARMLGKYGDDVSGVNGDGGSGNTTVINVGTWSDDQLEEYTNRKLQETRQKNISKPGSKG